MDYAKIMKIIRNKTKFSKIIFEESTVVLCLFTLGKWLASSLLDLPTNLTRVNTA